jgi:hypothetical protein
MISTNLVRSPELSRFVMRDEMEVREVERELNQLLEITLKLEWELSEVVQQSN